jgi:hypothetical protein
MSIRCLLEDPEEKHLERIVIFEHQTFIIAFPMGIQQMNLMRLR